MELTLETMVTIAEIQEGFSLVSNTYLPFEQTFNQKKRDFDLEHNMLAPMKVTLNNREFHTIDLNVGRPIHLCWRKDGAVMSSGVCQNGNVAALITTGQKVELDWSPEFNSLRVILSAEFVDRVMDISNFKFKSACNFSDPLLTELCGKLRIEKWQGENSVYAECLAIAIVIHLASQHSGDKKVFAPKGKLSAVQMNNIFEFTLSSIRKNIRLSELAEIANVSDFHFARLFKHTLGISPYRFVLQLKIEHAKKLIRNERKSCSDVAYLLNFSDQAHFSHVFKRFTGYSPRTFINALGKA